MIELVKSRKQSCVRFDKVLSQYRQTIAEVEKERAEKLKSFDAKIEKLCKRFAELDVVHSMLASHKKKPKTIYVLNLEELAMYWEETETKDALAAIELEEKNTTVLRAVQLFNSTFKVIGSAKVTRKYDVSTARRSEEIDHSQTTLVQTKVNWPKDQQYNGWALDACTACPRDNDECIESEADVQENGSLYDGFWGSSVVELDDCVFCVPR